jgi:hypothetical protein
MPGSQPTYNSNYSLLNSKNVHPKRGITPKNNSIGQKGMEVRVIHYFYGHDEFNHPH